MEIVVYDPLNDVTVGIVDNPAKPPPWVSGSWPTTRHAPDFKKT